MEQVEFLDGQFTGLSLGGDLVFFQVQGDVAADKEILGLGFLDAAPAEDGLHPAQ